MIGEGAAGESSRLVFKNELTRYDYEMKLTHPTRKEHLEELQLIMESYKYAPRGAVLWRIVVRHLSTRLEESVKAIISERPASGLVDLYEYAW